MKLQNDQILVLSRFYGWSFETIGNMTLEQIKAALEAILRENRTSEESAPPDDGNLHFATLDEWKLWRETNGM